MTPAQQAEVEAWLVQVDNATARIDAGTVAAVLAAYSSITDWESPDQTVSAAITAVAAAAAGRQAVAETGAHLVATTAAILRGLPERNTRAKVVDYPRSADPFDVFSRPIFVYRDAVLRGLDEQAAQIAAFQRAEMLALTDNLLARRNAALAALEDEQVTHYRRVIRPELSKTGTCGLCIAAASRVYTRSDLMPIHTRCKCDVIPVVGSDDPGEQFNLADIRQIYADLPATSRAGLARTRYRVERDTELGPVLTPAA